MEVFAMDEWEAAAEWLRTTTGVDFQHAKQRVVKSLAEMLSQARKVGISGFDFGRLRRILFVPFDQEGFNRLVWLYVNEIELAQSKLFWNEYDFTDEDMEREWALSGYTRP